MRATLAATVAAVVAALTRPARPIVMAVVGTVAAVEGAPPPPPAPDRDSAAYFAGAPDWDPPIVAAKLVKPPTSAMPLRRP